MARPYLRNRAKERFWRRQLKGWRRSGQTIRDYCRQQGLKEPSFYAWRSELARRDQEHHNGDSRPLVGNAVTERRVARRRRRRRLFVPVHVAPTTPTASVIEVLAPSGHVLRVGAGADVATLRQVLDALTSTPSEVRPC